MAAELVFGQQEVRQTALHTSLAGPQSQVARETVKYQSPSVNVMSLTVPEEKKEAKSKSSLVKKSLKRMPITSTYDREFTIDKQYSTGLSVHCALHKRQCYSHLNKKILKCLRRPSCDVSIFVAISAAG